MRRQYHFNFEDLKVYQKAMEFGESVNNQVENFPDHEIYKLSSQFIRAADSIALNIAEGSASTDPNFIRYLKMVWDSSHECVAISTKAKIRSYITFREVDENKKQITEISKMISSLIKHLKNK
ncbi:four helix bundle protein [Mesonia sediminis]|uniref:Four helix bundle protein n=1 Tax=Mesonia sediminis TaxID=1703946 RepID=A0ABW5SCY5_9FLAO